MNIDSPPSRYSILLILLVVGIVLSQLILSSQQFLSLLGVVTVFVSTLINPLIGLGGMMIASPIRNIDLGVGVVTVARLMGILTLFSVFARYSVTPGGQKLHFDSFGVSIFGLVLALFPSLILARYEIEPVLGEFISLISLIFMYYLIVILSDSERNLNHIIYVLLLSAVVPVAASVQESLTNPNSFTRIVGTFSKPTGLAQFLIPVTLFTLGLGITKRFPQGALFFAYVPIQIYVLVFTGSRHAWLAIMAGSAYLAWVFLRRSRFYIVPIFLVVLFMIGFGSTFSDPFEARLSSRALFSGREPRLAEVERGWQIFLDMPLLGTGISDYPAIAGERGMPRDPHVIWVKMFVQLGLVGGLAFIFFLANIGSYWRRVMRHERQSGSGASSLEMVFHLSTASILAYIAAMTLQGGIYTNEFWLVLGLFRASGALLLKTASNESVISQPVIEETR